MRAITLALRGLWWRRSASLVIALVAVVCTAAAAAGPAYLGAARDAVVQTTLRDAARGLDGTGISVSRRAAGASPTIDALRGEVGSAFAGLIGNGMYVPPVVSIASAAHVVDVSNQTAVTSPLVYREDLCAHVVMTSGACSEAPGAALVSETTAAAQGWDVGTALPFVDFGPKGGFAQLTVAGVYRPVDVDSGYWFDGDHGFLGATAATDAVFIGADTWTDVPDGATVTLYADLALRPGAVHASDLGGLADAVRLAAARLRADAVAGDAPDLVSTGLPSVVFSADRAAGAVSGPVLSIVAQLLVLTFAVLFLLMVGSHESRGSEVALGKLRGLSARATVSHALLEPTALLVAAVPVGVAVAALVLHAAAPAIVGPEAEIVFGSASWLAAVGAGVAGVVAGLAASVSVLRRPVLAQWQRTERRPRRVGWIIEAVVVVLAFAATSQLLGTDTTGRFSFLPSAAPALLAVAFALIGARVLPLVARSGIAATRATRFVALFVAVRQLARRQGGLRTFGVICVAVALVVFGLCSQVVFQANRQARAVADIGADRVVLLQSAPVGTDVAGIVDGLDPGGKQATAVYQGSFVAAADDALSTGGATFVERTSSVTPSMLVVDPERFAKVTSWSSRWGGGATAARALAPLTATAPQLIRLSGTSLRATGTVRSSTSEPVVLEAGLTDRLGRNSAVTFGSVRAAPGPNNSLGAATAFDLTLSVAACNDGCLLRRLSVVAPVLAKPPLSQRIDLTGITASDATGAPTSLQRQVLASTWTSFGDGTSVLRNDDALEISIDAADPAGGGADGFGALAGVPLAAPAVVTTTQRPTISGGQVTVSPEVGTGITVQPTLTDVLPRAGDAGVLVTRDWLAATQPEGYGEFAPNEVWLSAAAPADFPDRLTAAGLVVASVDSVAGRAARLARQGPSLAVAALVFGAAIAALLAVAGSAATFVVASRRRLYELAALRALGLRPRRIWFTVALEQVVTAAAAALFGAVAGLVGARIALQALPEFGDTPSFPAIVVDLPVGGSALAAALVALAVGVITGLLGVNLVRAADTTRLRETQG